MPKRRDRAGACLFLSSVLAGVLAPLSLAWAWKLDFGAPAYLGTGQQPKCVVVADLNSDGYPDLVVSNTSSNTVSVFLGNGDGTFQSRSDYPVGTMPWFLAVG